MKEQYWKQFTMTGKVEDYLKYKAIKNCRDKIEKNEDEKSESVNYSDRDDPIGHAGWRI